MPDAVIILEGSDGFNLVLADAVGESDGITDEVEVELRFGCARDDEGGACLGRCGMGSGIGPSVKLLGSSLLGSIGIGRK